MLLGFIIDFGIFFTKDHMFMCPLFSITKVFEQGFEKVQKCSYEMHS